MPLVCFSSGSVPKTFRLGAQFKLTLNLIPRRNAFGSESDEKHASVNCASPLVGRLWALSRRQGPMGGVGVGLGIRFGAHLGVEWRRVRQHNHHQDHQEGRLRTQEHGGQHPQDDCRPPWQICPRIPALHSLECLAGGVHKEKWTKLPQTS